MGSRQPWKGFALALVLAVIGPAPAAELRPVVEVEENVYAYTNADNGAGPMWCRGSTCLAHVGEDLFASGLETLKDAKPLNNCRWLLFKRGPGGWERINADDDGRTREPCPLAGFPKGSLFLSVNPTLKPGAYSGAARPEVLEFNVQDLKAAPAVLRPIWQGTPEFTEHSYRSFAADGSNQELILFQNIGYTHAEWAFRDRSGKWSAQGQLKWPWGAEYDKPQPIRVCYPVVALQNRAVHFCGVSDIIEPYEKWRAFKQQLTGREWDYEFRRLFYTWSSDIRTGKFNDWIEIASRDKTCGWITPCDLWVAPDGAAHLLWTERALDERLREKFYPDAKQAHSLNYAVVKDGKVMNRRVLAEAVEGLSSEIPSFGRFHVTPDNRLLVVYYVHGANTAKKSVSENRLLEIRQDGSVSVSVVIPLKYPFGEFFTATVRAGSPTSRTLELLGPRVGSPMTISYARIRLGQ
jgi:hypothetical protein